MALVQQWSHIMLSPASTWDDIVPLIFATEHNIQKFKTSPRRYQIGLNGAWAGIAVAWRPPGYENFGLNCQDFERLIKKIHEGSDASTDEQQIRIWAKTYPGAPWGYAVPKEIVVVDLDMKHGSNGIKEFEKLQGCNPNQFHAPRVATATGGMHVYTDAMDRDFANSVSKIAPGVDTRTEGGYVIIPSGPQSGYRRLTDLETTKPPTPVWTEAALHRISNFESLVEAKPFQGISLFGDLMLSSACNAIAAAPNGKQEKTLNDCSFQIGHFVGGGLLERDASVAALVRAGLRMIDYDDRDEWTEKEIDFKVRRAIDKGMLKPWDDGTELDKRTAEVLDRASTNPQYAKEVEDFLEEEDARRAAERATQDTAQLEQKAELQQEQPQQGAPKQDPPKHNQHSKDQHSSTVVPSLVRRMGKGLPPPVAFLVSEVFHKVGTGTIVSKYLGGKTFVGMALAASVATGAPFAGRTVRRKGGVLWLAAEGEREVDKRIRAAVKALEADPDEQPIYVQIASVPKLLSTGGTSCDGHRQARGAHGQGRVRCALGSGRYRHDDQVSGLQEERERCGRSQQHDPGHGKCVDQNKMLCPGLRSHG
jgi:hypothetical protein